MAAIIVPAEFGVEVGGAQKFFVNAHGALAVGAASLTTATQPVIAMPGWTGASPVSPSGAGWIRYNSATNGFEASTNAGAWAPIGGVPAEPANQVVFGTGSAIDSSADLTFDDTTNVLAVTSGVVQVATVRGGSTASATLALTSTSHATKATVTIGSALTHPLVADEVNGHVRVGDTASGAVDVFNVIRASGSVGVRARTNGTIDKAEFIASGNGATAQFGASSASATPAGIFQPNTGHVYTAVGGGFNIGSINAPIRFWGNNTDHSLEVDATLVKVTVGRVLQAPTIRGSDQASGTIFIESTSHGTKGTATIGSGASTTVFDTAANHVRVGDISTVGYTEVLNVLRQSVSAAMQIRTAASAAQSYVLLNAAGPEFQMGVLGSGWTPGTGGAAFQPSTGYFYSGASGGFNFVAFGGALRLWGNSTESTLEITGTHAALKKSIRYPLSTKTGAYTITENDHTILADATGGAFAVTLPAASSKAGVNFIVKRINSGANAVTIARTGSDTIDGATSRVLGAQYDVAVVQSDGTHWHVVGGTPPLTATQIAFGSSGNSITSSGDLTWDATNETLTVRTIDTAVNATFNAIALVNSSLGGTPAAGLGSTLLYRAHNGSGTVDQASISAKWTDAAASTNVSQIVHAVRVPAGMTDLLTLTGVRAQTSGTHRGLYLTTGSIAPASGSPTFRVAEFEYSANTTATLTLEGLVVNGTENSPFTTGQTHRPLVVRLDGNLWMYAQAKNDTIGTDHRLVLNAQSNYDNLWEVLFQRQGTTRASIIARDSNGSTPQLKFAVASGTAGTMEFAQNGEMGFLLSGDKNAALFGTGSYASGVKVLFIANRTTAPTTNPTGGVLLYAEGGNLFCRGGSGAAVQLN